VRLEKGAPIELFAPYAGQASSVLLGAVGASGDPSVGPTTVSVARSSFVPERVITPGQNLVKAARGG
jgi:hypothetical protein